MCSTSVHFDSKLWAQLIPKKQTTKNKHWGEDTPENRFYDRRKGREHANIGKLS